MKKLLLVTSLSCLMHAYSQTTIYQENFEMGNSFTMNTSDLGGSTTYNTWLMNNTYTGGSGVFTCLGFPFSFTVANTPGQPAGITGFPSSNYMHISAQAAVSGGINCASYIPADGTCVTNESNFTKMTNAISTVGYSNVNFDFWWLCAGSTTAYGELYYSLDNGTTWVLKQSNLNNNTTWTQSSFTDAAWSGQASIKFAFRFVNNVATTAADPSFCVDEIAVTGTIATTSIVTSPFSPTAWCFGNTISEVLDFNATGTYTAGNVFSAELSDATGSFAAPTIIGTLNSTASGPLSINVTIPGSTPTGAAYRIRVVSSNPVTVGSDNGTDITINANPTVTLAAFNDICNTAPAFSLSGGAPAGGNYSGTGVSGGMFDPAVAGAGTHVITYTYTDANSCTSTANESIIVDDCSSLDELNADGIAVYPNPATGSFHLSNVEKAQSVSLVDANGRVIRNYSVGEGEYSLEGVNAGTYFVRVGSEQIMSMKPLVVR